MPLSSPRWSSAPLARRSLALAGVAALAGAALPGAAPAAAATRVVTPSPQAPCKAAPAGVFVTIQAAVDAAQPGDQVVVCPGTYEERVVIARNAQGTVLDRLDVVSHVTRRATVRPPAGDPGGGAVVTVAEARGVGVRRFVVTGPAARSCPPLDAAVWVRDGATATVSQNDLPGTDCVADTAIRFGSPAEATTGGGLAQANLVSGYAARGIAATEAGTEVSLAANTVTGTAAGTGIEVAFGARGVVQANRISGAGTGIRAFLPAAARNVIAANTVGGAGRAIELVDVDRSRISSNRMSGNDEGLVADALSELNRFESNQARANATVDCRDDSTGGFGTAGTSNTWRGNRGAISAPAGICAP